MANKSVLELAVGTGQWDAGLKKAKSALDNFVSAQGGLKASLDKDSESVTKFVQMLGNIDSTAKTTKGQIRELTQTTADLTVAYRSLTDEERNSPFGQALADSIAKMTEKAGIMRDAMDDVNLSIKNAASDTRTFDQVAGAATFATSAFQTLQGAGRLLGIEMGDNVEVIAKLQAAMAVTNGLTQMQTLLQKESALMIGVTAVQTRSAAIAQSLLAKNTAIATAAGRAFNIVAKANPIGLLVTGVTAAVAAFAALSKAFGGASEKAKELAKAQEEAKKKQEEYQKSLNDTANGVVQNLYGKFVTLRAEWSKLQTVAEKTDFIKKNTDAFQDLNASIRSIKDAEDMFVNNSQAMVDAIILRARAAVLTKQIQDALANGITQPTASEGEQPNGKYSIGYGVAQNLANELADVNAQIDELMKKYQKGGGGGSSKTTQTEEQKNNAAITKMVEEYQKLATAEKTADEEQKKGISDRKTAIQGEIKTLTERNAELKKFADEAKSLANVKPAEWVKGLSGFNAQTMSAWMQGRQGDLQKVDYGTADYKAISGNIADMTAVKSMLETTIKNAIDTTQIDMTPLWSKMFGETLPEGATASLADVLTKMYEQAFGETDISDTAIQSVVDKINEALEEKGIKLKIDVGTGNGTESNIEKKKSGKKNPFLTERADGKTEASVSGLMGGIASGMSQMSSGMKELGIKVPAGFDKVASSLTAITSILTGISAIVSAIQAISTANLFKIFAGGGIVPHAANGYFVPGTHYSGDVTPIMANAGELVLNKSQQFALADQLQDIERGGIETQPYVTGEAIYLGLQNYTRRRGLGEVVTSRRG